MLNLTNNLNKREVLITNKLEKHHSILKFRCANTLPLRGKSTIFVIKKQVYTQKTNWVPPTKLSVELLLLLAYRGKLKRESFREVVLYLSLKFFFF